MKTKYLSEYTLNEEHQKDFIHFQELDTKEFDRIIEWYSNQDEMPSFSNNMVAEFVKGSECPPNILTGVFYRVYRLLDILRDEENSVEGLIDDFESAYPDAVKDKAILETRLKAVEAIVDKYMVFFGVKEARDAGVGHLNKASVSTFLKPVIINKFDPSVDDIKTYKPVINQYEPGILFEMKKSDDEIFSFQMTPENFEKMLNHFISIQIELKALKDGLDK